MKIYLTKILILITVSCFFYACADTSAENKGGATQSTNTVTPKKIKTIILLDVSGSFRSFMQPQYDCFELSKQKIDKLITTIQQSVVNSKTLQHITLRKIGVNQNDANLITSLDMFNGFEEQLNTLKKPCNQRNKADQQKCKENKANIRKEIETILTKRKQDFLKILTSREGKEMGTDIVNPLKHSLSDLEGSKALGYDKRRIIIFSDMQDETQLQKNFVLELDKLDYIDEILIFYAKNEFAEIWRQKLKGNKVRICQVSNTDEHFSHFLNNLDK